MLFNFKLNLNLDIFQDLVKMFGNDYVGRFPVFEYNLVSDFELTTNEAGEMVKPSEKEKVKLRLIFNELKFLF
jgi:hypothetical protein